MLMDNKVVIVSGVGPGLGQANARALARDGATVVLAARNVARLEELKAEVEGLGAVALLAVGLVRIAEGARASRAWSLLCAGVGLFTVALHALFLVLDREAFWAPASLAVLAGILVTSIGQLLRLPPAAIPSVSPDARSSR